MRDGTAAAVPEAAGSGAQIDAGAEHLGGVVLAQPTHRGLHPGGLG
jgi:hypothetical protein